MKHGLLITPLAVCLVASLCSATTYHVSVSGSDSSEGSSEAPLKTLARAAQLAKPGDTVLIGAGTYRETLTPQRSGEPGASITYAAAPGAHPVITGCDVVDGWKKNNDGVWEATVQWDLGPGSNQLFFGGMPLTEARHPNKTSAGLLEHDLQPLRFPVPGTAAGAAFATETPNRWAGAYFFGHGYEAWAFQCAHVSSSEDDRLTFQSDSKSKPWFEKPMRHGDPARLAVGDGAGFVYGIRACLDAEGEWLWDKNRILLIPPNEETPTSQLVEARRRGRTVNLHHKNHIVIRGLTLLAGTVCICGDHNLMEDCQGTYLSHFLNFKEGFELNGGRSDGVAVSVHGENNVVRGCHISKTAGCGIGLFGKGNLVTRCLIEEIDYAGTYGACISVSGEKQHIVFNTLRMAGRDCMQINSNHSNSLGGHMVVLNDISYPGQVCMDTGILYFFGTNGMAPDGTGTHIAYNWVHDNSAKLPAPGIYLDNYVRNFLVHHNVVWNVQNDAGIRINAPSDSNTIFNNTLFYTKPVGSHTYNAFPMYNPDTEFWSNKDIYNIVSANNLELGDDPSSQLADPEGLDFSLKSDAPAIGAGEPIQSETSVAKGENPDLGAYQSGRPAWKAGREGYIEPSVLESMNIQAR